LAYITLFASHKKEEKEVRNYEYSQDACVVTG
jgi:hypothetical protein